MKEDSTQYRLKLDASKVRNLSFPDCDVTKMEFSAGKKTLQIFLDGAWVDEEGGGMLGDGFLSLCNWDSLTITIFDAKTKTYSIVEQTQPEYLEDICEFKVFDSILCLCGFSDNYWMEWEIVNPEVYAEFEPEADL